MNVESILVLCTILCISLPLTQAEDRVIFDELPVLYDWAIHEGSDTGASLKENIPVGDAQSGDHCAEVVFTRGSDNWASIYITATGDDQRGGPGPKPEDPGIGLDLTGAKKLVFYAKGAHGNEKITFGYGFDPSGVNKYGDSSQARRMETLTNFWKKYEFDLAGKDLSHVNGLFMINAEKQYNPVDGATFYVDNIRYEYFPPPPPPIYAMITRIDNATDLKDGIEVARRVNAIGEYEFNETFKSIWTFVVPLTGGLELYYPQYNCEGTSVTSVNGKWESRISLGNDNADEDGGFFGIVVMVCV